MRKFCAPVLLVASMLLLPVATARAQTGGTAAKPTSSYDRLYLGFAKDATVADKQWWEGRAEISNGDAVDLRLVRGVIAIQPWQNLEIGGSVGFGSSDAPGNTPDGRGATDLDLWGKYYLGGDANRTEFAVGTLITLPTGDESEGLGADAFGLTGFGSLRYRMSRAIVTFNAGLQFNGDGETPFGLERNGKTSAQLAGGVIFPFSDEVGLIGEVQFHGERFEGGENDARVLGGVNWRAFNRGMLRAAITLGLSDGAPDSELQAGYAVVF